MTGQRYRLPADTRMGPVRLQVADLGRALGFYEDLLGFTVFDRTATTAAAGVGEDDPLVVLEARPGTRARPERTPGLYHIAVLYPDRRDLGRVLLRAFERGVPFQGFADHGVSEAAYLADPDGNGIELYADRPRQQWQRGEDGGIVMYTHVLNVTGLLRAVDGDPWIGPPAGTLIGHVHLHVTDLESAVAFYRDALGMDVTNASYPGAVFLSAGGYHHHIAVNTWATGSRPPAGSVAGLIHFSIRVSDAADREALGENLEAHGASIESVEGGFETQDPDGNRIRVG